MRFGLTSIVLAAFVLGSLLGRASALVPLAADGNWWQTLNADQKYAVVIGMVSAYNVGRSDGEARQVTLDKPYIEYKLKSEHLTPLNRLTEEGDWLMASIDKPGFTAFTKTYKTYTDAIDNYYENNPDLKRIVVGEIMSCSADGAKDTCDKMAAMARHSATSPP